ncbi:MAG: PadR family transcriptional regulator, regulatory protein PadR [Actinomycetota bacterium]|jgi:DNA-binding PadR family transcriptional regulator|nr:PadR family transcriptional regulator, regulatory protein PadR [Actinomycetota bacterium]MEA2487751.1 PadR family transcriptional regulator, regulatory protein PadR [Actinomycetota bacterium]
MQADLLKGHLEGLVLAVLAERPIHGYAIMESLKARSHGAIGIEGGTLYPLLHRLEEAGLVRSSWSTQGGRRRRTYSLTARGGRALAEKQGAWREFVSALGSIMAEPSTGPAK